MSGMKLLIHSLMQRCNRLSWGMDKWFDPILYNGCNYLSMLGLKLDHVSKRGPWCAFQFGSCPREVFKLPFNHPLMEILLLTEDIDLPRTIRLTGWLSPVCLSVTRGYVNPKTPPICRRSEVKPWIMDGVKTYCGETIELRQYWMSFKTWLLSS